MQSDAWKMKKQEVWRRAKGVCERCKERRGAHVHHLWYAQRRGCEPLESLQLVCLPCHSWYHPHHTFLTPAQQIARANEKKARRKAKAADPWRNCAHCGGQYPKGKHREICVKYGLDKRRETGS